MNQILRLELFREIRKSKKRYISLLLIVALGVAFYTGVRSSGPDMQYSVDRYYDDRLVMDLRLISDWGFDDDDVAAVSKLACVETAVGYRSVDVVSDVDGKAYNLTVMEHTIGVNEFALKEGRMPTRPGECVVDPKVLYCGDGLAIGDTISVRSGKVDQDLSESLTETEYTIVGVGTCPWFLSYSRGTCSTGDGDSDGYVLVCKETFAMNYYMQMFVRIKDAKKLGSFTDAYQNKIDAAKEEIALSEYNICLDRYDRTKLAAEEEIASAEQEIATAKTQISDGEAALLTAKQTLEEKEEALASGLETLNQGKEDYEKGLLEYEEAKKKLEDGTADAAAGSAALETAKVQLQDAKKQVEEGKLALAAANAVYTTALSQQAQYHTILDTLQKQLDDEKAALEASDEQNAVTLAMLERLQTRIDEYSALLAKVDERIVIAKQEIDQYQAEVAEGEAKIAAAEAIIEENSTSLIIGQTELTIGYDQLKEAKEQLDAAKAELDAGFATYEEGRAALDQGWETYREEQKEADRKLADAKQQIADGEAAISEANELVEQLTVPIWTYYDRNTIQSYVEYSNDADRINRIGRIFPVIFFLVAALVALTTMTRMVDEQRTQIGTMKALGYTNTAIALRFLIYALSSTALGCIIGIVVGEWGLPRVILLTYGMMYTGIPHFYYKINMDHVLLASLAALCSIAVATFGACFKEFMANPANLMRPLTPKSGRKLLLERVAFLWKRIPFSLKATIRNLARYKKRLIMTVVGIGGCMGILVTSFGLRDSIYAIARFQFSDVMHYDCNIGLDLSKEQDAYAVEEELLTSFPHVKEIMAVQMTSVEVGNGEISKSTYMMVPDAHENFENYIQIRNRKTKEAYVFPTEGVAISEKLALCLDKKVGDSITITYQDRTVETTVSCIFENYVYHYMFLTKETYEALFLEEPEYATFLINMDDAREENRQELATKVLADSRFASVSFLADTYNAVGDMLNNLNLVIIVLIISGGLLAFIVLFNLNNINITERRRELATLEVLGFYDFETAMYVYRENVVLTLLGIAAGLFFGKWLHLIVVETVEVDVMMFGRSISTGSYVGSALLTLIFAIMINAMMLISIHQIDMVESLKSVE